MKKVVVVLSVCSFLSSAGQTKNEQLLRSNNIKEIENFLKSAHPDDPRRRILIPKLNALKNQELLSKNIVVVQRQNQMTAAANNYTQQPNENAEFQKLMQSGSNAHTDKTVKLLNGLFDNDPSSTTAILLVQNGSDCNIILRVNGKQNYNLAVPARGENSVVIEKGSYTLVSTFCGLPYYATKSIVKHTQVSLNSTAAKAQNQKYAQRPLGLESN